MLTFDIETVPLASSMAEPYPEGDRSPPSNWKDEAKIVAWYADDRQKWEDERVKTYSLNPRQGRVVAIGFKSPSSPVPLHLLAKTESEEADVLAGFWQQVKEYGQVAGFHSLGFDLPFLVTRSLVLGVSIPVRLPDYLRRYNYTPHLDLRMALANWDSRASGTLDDWCKAFRIEGKRGDGAQVYGLVTGGKWDELTAYLRADVEATVALAERVGPAFGVSC